MFATTSFNDHATKSSSLDDTTFISSSLKVNETTSSPSTTTTATTITTTTSPQSVSKVLQFAGINIGLQTDFLATISTAQDALPFLTAPMNTSVKSDIGHQFYEMVISCTFSSESCDSIDNFEQSYNPLLGNCYTFNKGEKVKYYVTQAGAPYGLRLVLYASQSDYMCTSLNAGFKVAIHENNLDSFPDSEGYYLSPGTVAYFNLRQIQVNRLSYPYGICANSELNSSYTVESCQRQCYQNYVLESCKCADPRYELPLGKSYCTLPQKECLDFVQSCEDNYIKSTCNCPPRCSETRYQTTVTTATFIAKNLQKSLCDNVINETDCQKSFQQGFALIYMFYDSLTYFSYTEEPAYPILTLLSDFSGVTGLLLGLCAMSVFEVAMFVYFIAYGFADKLMK